MPALVAAARAAPQRDMACGEAQIRGVVVDGVQLDDAPGADGRDPFTPVSSGSPDGSWASEGAGSSYLRSISRFVSAMYRI